VPVEYRQPGWPDTIGEAVCNGVVLSTFTSVNTLTNTDITAFTTPWSDCTDPDALTVRTISTYDANYSISLYSELFF